MKHLFITLLVSVCSLSVSCAQEFFINHPDPKISVPLQTWVSNKGYTLLTTLGTDGYSINAKFQVLEKHGYGKVFFEIVENKTSKIIDAIEGDLTKSDDYLEYLSVADEKLSGALKKLKEAQAVQGNGVEFKSQSLSVVRTRLDSIVSVKIGFGGKVTDLYEVRITKISSGEDVVFHDNPNSIVSQFYGNGLSANSLVLRIKGDSTIKDQRVHNFRLQYRIVGSGEYTDGSNLILRIDIPYVKKSVPEKFYKNDLMLFIGTTLDPNNTTNKIKGLSLEAFVPFQISDQAWLRIGGYLHPNFSRDSASYRRTDFFKLNSNPLVTDKSYIGRQSSRLDIANSIESIGVYMDMFWPLKDRFAKFKDKDLIRVSPFMHFEWARRTETPKMVFSALSTDSLIYKADGQYGTIKPQKPTAENFFTSRTIRTQVYLTAGTSVEAHFPNLYLLYQMHVGIRQEFINSTFGNFLTYHRYQGSVNIKLMARIKEAFNLSVDLKNIFSGQDYINISFGIPVNLTEILKKQDGA